MDDDFDIDSAVTEVSEGLGLEITPVQDLNTPFSSTPSEKPEADVTGAVEKPAADASPATTGTPTPPAAPSPTDFKVPASWRPEAKAEFDKLPPVIKAEVVKREEDILRGIGEYKAAANFGQAIDKAISPYAPLMRQHNIDPVHHVSELMGMHKTLALGSPQERQEVLRTLAKNFNVELGQLSQSADDSPYVDPEVAHLRSQLSQIQSIQQQLVNQQTQAQQAQIQQVRAGLANELNTFAADVEHAFFDEVAPDMAILIQSGRASSLKQAYDLALRMNPASMEKETLRVAAKTASTKQVSLNAVAAKTTAARNATGVNVRTSGGKAPGSGSVSPTPGLQNLDKSIEAAFDQIMTG